MPSQFQDKYPFHPNQKDMEDVKVPHVVIKEDYNICPECGWERLIRQGNCWTCPLCGASKC